MDAAIILMSDRRFAQDKYINTEVNHQKSHAFLTSFSLSIVDLGKYNQFDYLWKSHNSSIMLCLELKEETVVLHSLCFILQSLVQNLKCQIVN